MANARDDYEYGQPLRLYYRFDDAGDYIEDFAHFGERAYYVQGPVTTAEAYPMQGWDDQDGDGLPEWWIKTHGLDNWPNYQDRALPCDG